MKTFVSRCLFSLVTQPLSSAALASIALASFASAQLVNPDPDIFDGSKTKREIPQQEAQKTVDNWEGPNLIIYDSKEQGNGKGGTGFADGQGPGLDIGLPGIPGLPIPLGGGGGGGSGDPSLNPLQIPGGAQSTPGAGGQKPPPLSGAAQSAARPSPVSIGDPSQQIATTAQGQAGNVAAPAEGGEEGAKKAGEDSTQIPSAASTSQTGTRGGGVEQGDAMPPDL